MLAYRSFSVRRFSDFRISGSASRERAGGQAQPFQLALQHAAPVRDELRAARLAKISAYLAPRAGGAHDAQPVVARLRGLAGEYLDHIACAQLVVQRRHASVHSRADAAMPYLRVDAVGEVDRRRAFGQVNQVALRGEHQHLIGRHVAEDAGEELQVALEVGQVAQLLLEGGQLQGLLIRALFVAPVRRDAVLSDLVHLPSANLHFERALVWTDDFGVQRLVAVGLGRGDVIIKQRGNRLPQFVNNPQRHIALLYRVGQHAQRDDVVDLVVVQLLLLHLAEDAPEVLGASHHIGAHAALPQPLLEGVDELQHFLLAFGAGLGDLLADVAVLLGIEVLEGEVVQLRLDLVDAQSVGEWGVDLQRLGGDLHLLFGRHRVERLHIVQAVGEFDDHHAQVFGDRHQQFAQVVGGLGDAHAP
jgi:hypothetical protein